MSKRELIGKLIVDVEQGDDYIILTLENIAARSRDIKVKIEAFAQYNDATISTEVIASDT